MMTFMDRQPDTPDPIILICGKKQERFGSLVADAINGYLPLCK